MAELCQESKAPVDPLGNFREILTLLGISILAGLSIIKRYDYSFATLGVYTDSESSIPGF